MSNIDFFVHPEFAFMSQDKESRYEYFKTIVEIARESKNPILVNPIIRNKGRSYYFNYEMIKFFDKVISNTNRHLNSNSMEMGEDYYPYGHIHHSSWKKLEQICENLDEKSKIKIHGCFYENQCCYNLAIQLYGLLKFKKHWYNREEEPSIFSALSVLYEEGRINFFDLFDNLARTNIRYGVVFSSESIGFKHRFSFIPRNLSFINYVNKQLTDDKTKIYGKMKNK